MVKIYYRLFYGVKEEWRKRGFLLNFSFEALA